MSPHADRLLTRLWLALAASSVLATGLDLGAAIGARRWPGLATGATAAPRREAAAASSPAMMEPEEGSLVKGCQPRSSDAKLCRHLPEE